MPLRTFINTILFTFLSISAFSQAPVIQWQKSLGGSAFEYARGGISQTVDGGYIIVGETESNDGDVTGNHGNTDVWVVRLDSNGNIQWQKTFGGSNREGGKSVHQTFDGGCIISGFTYSNDGDVTGNHGGKDVWVIKLDSNGGIQWQKALGGSGSEDSYSFRQTADSGYIMAASTQSADGDVTGTHGLDEDMWIVKLSATGSIQWQKALGGSSAERSFSIRQTFDGGYIVAGLTSSNDGDVSGNHGLSDCWIVKLSSSGSIQWQKALGGSGGEFCFFSEQTLDSGYIVAGISNSNDGDVSGNHGGEDAWIVKLSAIGVIQWEKAMGGSNLDIGIAVHQTSDSGYIVAGISESTDGDASGNHGGEDAWIVKLSPTGSINWRRSYGGSGYDAAYDIRQTKEGGYIFAGGSSSTDGDVSGNHGDSDFWVVKLSPCYANAGSITGPDTVCQGAPITFVATLPGGVWGTTNGNGAFSGGTFTATSPGVDTITYTVTDSCGTATAAKPIHIKPLNAIAGPDSICAWSPVLLTSTVPGGIWALSNTKASINDTGLFVGMSPGLDSVYYIVSNYCGTDTATKTISIIPLAEAGYIISVDRVCIGDTITVTNAIQGGTWYHANATTLFIDSIVVGLSTGIDTIVYRVVNSCGIDSAFRFVTVTAYPDAGKITGASALCVGQTIRLTDTSKGGIWKSTARNTFIYDSVLVVGKTAGVDTITYRITNICASDTALWPLTINPLPAIPIVTRSGNELSVPFGYTSYQWMRNADVIPDATTRYLMVDSLANYYAVVTNDLGCSVQSFPQTVTDLYCNIDDLRLYPNPVESIIYIDWCRKVDVALLGMDGKEIKATHLNRLDVSHLPNGTYHLSIFDEQGKRLRTSRITKLSQ